jgi:hypothetical protein
LFHSTRSLNENLEPPPFYDKYSWNNSNNCSLWQLILFNLLWPAPILIGKSPAIFSMAVPAIK